jgi:putative ABC transport system permease protein
MLRSLTRLLIRRSVKNFTYSVIVLAGLIAGLTSAILVFLWSSYEFQYDRHDPGNQNVFAVMSNESVDGVIETYEEAPGALAAFLRDIPEVQSFTRIDNTSAILSYSEKEVQRRGMYADSGYFDVFRPAMRSAKSTSWFPDNQSVVLSRHLAETLFGETDVVGKMVMLDHRHEYQVTGVFDAFPVNSSLHGYDFILPFHARPREADEWFNHFVRLHDASSNAIVAGKIDQLYQQFPEDADTRAFLFCLTDWRLHWNFENGQVSGGRIVYVIVFCLTAVFILLMAGINYVNTVTANATLRAREIGVRKMTGASQRILIGQFLWESLVFALTAGMLSLGAAYLLLPLFNQLIGVHLIFDWTDSTLWFGVLTITVVLGLLAGMYPAFLLSSLRPAMVLKGTSYGILMGSSFRRVLTVFQFSLSVILIFCALVLYQQTNFLLNKELGYDRHHVINIWLPEELAGSRQALKSELMGHSSVKAAGLAGASPMEVNGNAEVHWSGEPTDSHVLLYGMTADHDVLASLGLELVQGQNFAAGDSASFIINERAAALMGLADPVGETITYTMFGEQRGKIVGVVRDFQNDDIHRPSAPVILVYSGEHFLNNLFVRYADGEMERALEHTKAVFAKFQPGVPLPYSFLDDDFEQQFYNEKLLGRFSAWATFVALLIAGLGLLGLAMFHTNRRVKEIGVRKVLGASEFSIVMLLGKEYLYLMVSSLVMAFPVAYLMMHDFLSRYPFRVDLSVMTFVTVGICLFVFVILVVAQQCVRAARQNPVKSLKVD